MKATLHQTDIPQAILNLNLEDFCDHLLDTHHAYIRSEGPLILELLQQVQKKHPQNALFPKIELLFAELYQDLLHHLPKEEQVLFPLCKKLQYAKEAFPMHCGSLSNPIRVMHHEHDAAERTLNSLRKLTQNYQGSDDFDTVAQSLYKKLQAFDSDLVIHMHKENEILFPRIQTRENELS